MLALIAPGWGNVCRSPCRVARSILEENSKDLPQPWPPPPVQCSFLTFLVPTSNGCLTAPFILFTVPLHFVDQIYSNLGHWAPFPLAPVPFSHVPLWVCFLWFFWPGLWFGFLVYHDSLALHLIFLAPAPEPAISPRKPSPFLESRAKNKIGVLSVLLLECLLF